VGDNDSEPQVTNMTKQGQKSRGSDQFKDPHVRKVAEEASIPIRQKTVFDNLFLADVDEIAVTVWRMAHGF
jgi:hypothetical protein